jgi:hypothetical protein
VNEKAANSGLTEACAPGIQQLQACRPHQREAVRRKHRWCIEYADFVAAYNATVAHEGLPLEQRKTF